MVLLNPNKLTRKYREEKTKDIMEKTVAFFESKGKQQLKTDDHQCVWYEDFLEFQKKEKIFSTLLTPNKYGGGDCRWDTWRNLEFTELLGFYGLSYWYTWQVTVLGLGPIWMSKNKAVKKQAAEQLADGEIFAFGLSEKTHGADIYTTDMVVTELGDDDYRANGGKYYIGNANAARMISTFGRLEDNDEYVFFIADSQSENFNLIQNVVNRQSYVAEFALEDYHLKKGDFIHEGNDAWYAALNTVNIGKFQLGMGAIGTCTHALYEAISHAANRTLYNMRVTDFPHIKRMFTDAWARLVAMKLFNTRASDYIRCASPEDRRYLLFTPMVKMKVTMQGEVVVDLLRDIVAAKGFEKDSYLEMATRDIAMLPRLEGTAHVNMALVLKFMANYLFNPAEFTPVPTMDDPVDDAFLFNQGPTKGLGHVRFADDNTVFDSVDSPNLRIFKEQIAVFKEMLNAAPPDDGQLKNIDFMLALGEIFTLIPYGQLIIEGSKRYPLDRDVLDQIFDFMVRDLTQYATQLHGKEDSTEAQMAYCIKMIRKADVNPQRFNRIWEEQVYILKDAYCMNE